MGDVSFSAVASPAVVYDGCGLRGVTCYGDGRQIAVFEEIDAANSRTPQRLLFSTNNGATWTEGATYFGVNNLWFYQAYAPARDVILVGTGGPQFGPTPSADDAIARSTDGGLTWGKAVADSLFGASDFWDIQDFIPLDNQEILATGSFRAGGIDYNQLRSTDNGVSFASPQATTIAGEGINSIVGGAHGGGQVVIAGVNCSSHSARVLRSTDRGATWTEIVLPNTQHAYLAGASSAVRNVIYLGANVWLACGAQSQAPGNQPPKLWRSIDHGLTWSEITDSLPGWTAGVGVPARRLLNLGGGRAIVGLTGTKANVGNSHWRLTEDYGVTWATCSAGAYASPNSVTIQSMALADNGNVMVTLGFAGTSTFQIWVGVPTGFTVAGPCTATDFLTVTGVLGAPESGGAPICTAFIAGCPQDCPDDPPADAPTVIVNTNVSFLSPLFFLGLGPTAGATVAMTTPADCGAMFANNLAAQECV